MTVRLSALAVIAAFAPLVGLACGGAPAARQDKAGKDSLAAAEADLAAAEARITGGTAAMQGDRSGAADPAPRPSPEPAPPPPARPPTEAAGRRPLSEPGEEVSTADSCASACEALSAMKKAADRICELAPGERCDSARARVVAAEKRVMEACPGCEA